MVQNFSGGGFWLGGGHIPCPALFAQGLQQLPDTVVGLVFKFSDGDVTAPEDAYRFVRPLLRDAELLKSAPQRWAYKYAHLLSRRHGIAHLLEGILGAVNDSFPGFR